MGVDSVIMEHHLNIIADARPVKQKRHHFFPNKDKVTREEVQKLMEAKNVREVRYPTWLSNVVLIPSHLRSGICVWISETSMAY